MRYIALDSLRGICALAVVLFHFPLSGAVREFPLAANGYLFVDFFFVLSGFVIADSSERRLRDRSEVWPFLIRRFGRLWPLHVAMLSVFVAVAVVRGDVGADPSNAPEAIWSHLFLIHGLGLHDGLTWNGPSWSISVEAFLYLTFAAVSLLPKREAIYVALVAGSWLVLAFWAPHGMASTFDYGVFRGLAGFYIGVLITRLPSVRMGTAEEVGALALVAAFVGVGHATLLAPAVFGLAVYVFAHARGTVSKALALPPFLRLGEWSYSIYMTHAAVGAGIWALAGPLGLTADGAKLAAPTTEAMCVIAAAYVLVTVAVSAATYRVIESPFRRAFNDVASAVRRPLAA